MAAYFTGQCLGVCMAQNRMVFAGGQVGCGKTHICTGIVRELIKQGREARYMLWRDESTAIKATVKYPEEYAALVEPLKTVDVLYIDDFLKPTAGNLQRQILTWLLRF